MRVLVVRNELPWPLHFGGRLHCYELCRRLAVGHELLLLAERAGESESPPLGFDYAIAGAGRPAGTEACADGREQGWSRRESSEMRLPSTCEQGCSHEQPASPPGGRPRRPAFHHREASRVERYFGVDPAFTRLLREQVRAWRPDVVVGMGYLSLAHLARLGGVPVIGDLLDDEVLHRRRELAAGPWRRKLSDAKCLLASWLYQRRFVPFMDAISVVSEADADACRRYSRPRKVVCIPHGVDCEHYRPTGEAEDADRIVFWGGLEFGPNISAVLYFADRVWPGLKRNRPALRWSIVGHGCPPELERVRRLAGVEFTGFVKDIRPHVGSAAVAVVPMISGAGIKNKIMEAWALGKPVLCTPTALGSLPGVHGRNVWIARRPAELAEGLSRLLESPELRRRLGAAGRRTAIEECSWDRAAEALETLCEEVTAGRATPRRLPVRSGHRGRPEPCGV